MSRTTGSTAKSTQARQKYALGLLMEGFAPATAVKRCVEKYSVTPQQARRYVSAARLDYFGDRSAQDRNDLEWSIAFQLDQLELIADNAREAGSIKDQISAIKAGAAIRERRLQTLLKEQFLERQFIEKPF